MEQLDHSMINLLIKFKLDILDQMMILKLELKDYVISLIGKKMIHLKYGDLDLITLDLTLLLM